MHAIKNLSATITKVAKIRNISQERLNEQEKYLTQLHKRIR